MQHAADAPKDGGVEHGGEAGGAKGAKDGGGGSGHFKFGRIAPGVQHRIANKGETANEKKKGANVKDSVALGVEVLDGALHIRPIGRCEVVRRKVWHFLVALAIAKIATLETCQFFCHSWFSFILEST